MGQNKKNLKYTLYQLGIEALSGATGKKIESYYCPICGNSFKEEDINNNILTLEHIPPEAQAGKGIALTCVDCNNTAGRTVDIAVTNRNHLEKLNSMFSQKGSVQTRVRVDFGQENLNAVNYELSVNNGSINFYPVKGANRPDYADNMLKLMRLTNNTSDNERASWKMSSRKSYSPWHAKVGDLRSAFLACFAKFGYNYAFVQALIPVREQIQNYKDIIIDYFCISLDQEINSKYTIGIVKNPFSAIFCQLRNFGIFLPWIGSPKNFYKSLEMNGKDLNKLSFDFDPISWPTKIEAKLDLPEI